MSAPAQAQAPLSPSPSSGGIHTSLSLDVVVEALAERLTPVIEAGFATLAYRLAAEPAPAADPRRELVDAATLAVKLGVSRPYVYEHADRLGVLRLGDGTKARLRFDVETARAAMRRDGSEQSQGAEVPAVTGDAPSPGRAARRRVPGGVPKAGSILSPKEGQRG